MSKPLATAKRTASDQQALIDLFQRLGHSSLKKAIAAQVDCEFYKELLKRVKANEPVPEFKGIPKAKVTKTLTALIAKTEKAQINAWALPAKAAALLQMTVKSFKITGDPIPCYDVLYGAGDGRNAVKIRITTRRKSLEVSTSGSSQALTALSSSLVLLMLR